MTTSLNYAPITQAPVRLWPLALGAAVVTVGTFVQLTGQWLALFAHSTAMWQLARLNTMLVNDLAVLAAVPLLAFALPREGGWTGRWKMIVCLILAGLRPLIRAAGGTFSMTAHSAAWNPLLDAMSALSLLLQLALLISAGIYLAMVATRLQRQALAVIAACALAPCVLYTAASLAYEVMFWLAIHRGYSINVSVAKIYSTSYALNLIWHFLVWLAIALYAGILALRKAR